MKVKWCECVGINIVFLGLKKKKKMKRKKVDIVEEEEEMAFVKRAQKRTKKKSTPKAHKRRPKSPFLSSLPWALLHHVSAAEEVSHPLGQRSHRPMMSLPSSAVQSSLHVAIIFSISQSPSAITSQQIDTRHVVCIFCLHQLHARPTKLTFVSYGRKEANRKLPRGPVSAVKKPLSHYLPMHDFTRFCL